MNDYLVIVKRKPNGEFSIGIGDDTGHVMIFKTEEYWQAMDCAKELRVFLERLRRKRGMPWPVEIKEL